MGFAAVLCALGLSAPAFAQAEGWTTRTVDDGKITVSYKVSTRLDDKGQEVPWIQYRATSTAAMTLESALALMRDPSRHHEFTGDRTSARVAVISADECIIHSHYSAPWPFPDNDRVTRMTVVEDPARKTAVITFTAAPTLYKETGVARVTYYQQVYTLKDVGGGKVEVVLDMFMSPPSPAPVWIIRASFPGSGADTLRKLIALAGRPQ